MGYSNAEKGIRKIYNYETIQIVIGMLALLIAILSAVGFDGDKAFIGDKGTVGAGLVILVAGIAIVGLTVVSIFILIKGLKLASKDWPENFKNAFYASLVVLVGSVLNGLSSSVEFIGNYNRQINAVVSAANVFMFLNIIMGIRSIADCIGRPDIVKLSVPIVILTIIITCASVIGRFIEVGTTGVFSGVLSLISYLIYIIYLLKAKDMF